MLSASSGSTSAARRSSASPSTRAHPSTVLAEDRVPTPDGGDGLVDVLLELARRARRPTPRPIGVGVPGPRRSGRHPAHGSAPAPHAATCRSPQLLDASARACPPSSTTTPTATPWPSTPPARRPGSTRRSSSPSAPASAPGSSPAGGCCTAPTASPASPGHMVVDPNGPPCPCGKRGCWERFASGTGLGRLARDAASGGRLDAAVALAGGDPGGGARRARHRVGAGRRRRVAGRARRAGALDRARARQPRQRARPGRHRDRRRAGRGGRPAACPRCGAASPTW